MKDYNGFSATARNRAQAWLRDQWRRGTLPRPSMCCACGQTEGVIDAHAEDYSEPFRAGVTDEFHLCFTCHMMVHCRFRNPEAWAFYRKLVSKGVRFAPFRSRDFGTFSRLFLGDGRLIATANHSIHPPQPRAVLDLIEASQRHKIAHGSRSAHLAE